MPGFKQQEVLDKLSKRTVQKSLLAPIIVMLVLLIFGFASAMIYTQKNVLEKTNLQQLRNAVKDFYAAVEKQSRVLLAIENLILMDRDLAPALLREDRDELFERYHALFEQIKKDYSITHFYFHLQDRTTLLRIHQKKIFGDQIDRITLLQAQQFRSVSHGLEIGPLGTFTLRVVQPVFMNGMTVGYIELGKEIEDILASIHKEAGVEMVLAIEKSRLKQDIWEEGMELLGRQARWNQFKDRVLAYSTFQEFPKEWNALIDETGHEHEKITVPEKYGSRNWHAYTEHFKEAGETNVGCLFLFVDATDQLSSYKKFTGMVLLAAAIVLILLLVIILITVKRTDQLIGRQRAIIQKSEKRFRSLFESVHDLVYTQDMKGCFTSVNPAMQKLFGYSPEELAGRSASEFMDEKYRHLYQTEYLDKIKKEGICQGISYYYDAKGAKFYIDYSSSLVQPENSEPYITGIGRDVTEKIAVQRHVRQLQEQINHAKKMESIGVLAGGIAHDFNNILFPMMGHTEMLLSDVPEDSPEHKSLEKIFSGAIRARDLVRQILEFSRQGSGAPEIMKVHPIIHEVLELMKSTIPPGISIHLNMDEDCCSIKADPTKIHQVVINLINNACHAMEGGPGRIEIGIRERKLKKEELVNPDMLEGRYLELMVSDTGIGMDSQTMENIFEPFYTTKEKGRGTGMGLAVVHGIVNSLGGGIDVKSRPGEGTCFRIYLPAAEAEPEIRAEEAAKEYKRGSEHILLVDDEEAIVIMEKEILERLGYTVTARTSSIEALEVFRAVPDRFDMVITDMSMPNMTGDQLSQKMIEISPEIPILLCTGFGEIMSKEKAASIGVRDILFKPVTIKDFSQKIRWILD